MRIVDGFVLRSVAGEMIISGESIAQLNFNKLISLNESAAFLWSELVGGEFTLERVVELLIGEYGINQERASLDASAIIKSWVDLGLIEQ